MITQNNLNSGKSLNKKKWSVATISAVFVIEFLLHSTLSSYGVFFNGLIENYNFKFHDALWTPVIYIASWNIITPWSRRISEYFVEDDHIVLQCISTATILCIACAFILCSIFQTEVVQIVLYGIIGGAGTGIILSQIKSVTYEEFQSKPMIYVAICQVAKSFGLFIVPHCILYIVSTYDVYRGQFIFASILMHVIPARLLVYNRTKTEASVNLSRYKTLPGYLWKEDSIELPTIKNLQCNSNTVSNSTENTITKLQETNEDTDESSSDCSDSYTVEEIKDEFQQEENLQSVRIKTDMGVEILPKIPEEDESDEDSKYSRKVSINIKRLSKMSGKFGEVIDKSNRLDSNILTNLSELESSINSRETTNNYIFFNDFRKKTSSSGLCCSPYERYLFRRRWRFIMDSINDNLFKPINTSFKTFYFYPALLTKTSTALIYVIFVTIMPHIALTTGVDHRVDVSEATFLLTFTSVSWFFFIISLPWLINVSKSRLKIFYILGLFITSGSLLLPYISLSHDMLTLSCLIFGCGYGIISYAEEIVHREWLGIRKWQQVSGTLETLSGMFVIFSYLVIFNLKLRVINMFLTLCIFVTINALLWIIAPTITFIWIYLKRSRNVSLFNT